MAEHRLLIVDDEESIRFALSSFFGIVGYQVDCARDAIEAGVMIDSGKYDCVIADLRLSGTVEEDGLKLAILLRSRNDSTPFVLLTAYCNPELEIDARRWGVDACVSKPIALPELASIVRRLTSKEPPLRRVLS